MNPDDTCPSAPVAGVEPSALARAVHAFIARVGIEPALKAFHAANRAGGKPLTSERVEAVLAGTAVPTLAMCEVVFEEILRAGQAAVAPSPPGVATSPPPDAPASVQPWAVEASTYEAVGEQPWMRNH